MPSVLAEVDIHPLHPDDPLRVNNDETHLGDARHAAHRLAGLGQKIVLGGDCQILVIENGQPEPTQQPDLSCVGWRVSVEGVDVGLCLEVCREGLQLTELLDAQPSTQAHVEDQHRGPSGLSRGDGHRLPRIVR